MQTGREFRAFSGDHRNTEDSLTQPIDNLIRVGTGEGGRSAIRYLAI